VIRLRVSPRVIWLPRNVALRLLIASAMEREVFAVLRPTSAVTFEVGDGRAPMTPASPGAGTPVNVGSSTAGNRLLVHRAGDQAGKCDVLGSQMTLGDTSA